MPAHRQAFLNETLIVIFFSSPGEMVELYISCTLNNAREAVVSILHNSPFTTIQLFDIIL